MDKKLRVGFLLDSFLVPAWIFRAIERLVSLPCTEVALVVLPRDPQKTLNSSGMRKHWLYHLFNRVDEKLFVRHSNALAIIDSTALLSKASVLEVETVCEPTEQSLLGSDVEKIRSQNLDILVKLGFGRLKGEILTAARYGLWAYRWGDRQKIEDGLTGFWEVAERWPETGASLQQRGINQDCSRTLFESWYFTYPYSPARSRNYVLWSAASFLPRQVERLYRLGEDKFYSERKLASTSQHSIPLRSNELPSNIAMLWVLLKLLGRNLREIYHRLFFWEQWELLFHLGETGERDISTFRNVVPAKDSFWADPHIVYREPNYYIFVEEFPYRTKRGLISVIEMDEKGNCQQPVPVLQKDYHLSFPFVFSWLDRYYMIPESAGNATIDLYESVRFPYEWKHGMTLMKDIKAVDTTVIFANEKWWLFTAIAEQAEAAPQVELFLFYSDDLFTNQWHAHPQNPIVSDVKRARGAGAVFFQNGRLFRPSQDCSKAYGYGFDLNEIMVLSETEYSERTVKSVRPSHKTKFFATHTYARQGHLTVVDALTRRPKWAKPA